MVEKPYRPCVVGVFIEKSKVLVAQRSDANKAWQFPQGGVEEGETYCEALFREMKEELGCNQFEIVEENPDLLTYDFPKEMGSKIAKEYKGQRQKWFLCQFISGHGPNLELASDKEFSSIKWIQASEVLGHVIWWKKDVYRQALTFFKLI